MISVIIPALNEQHTLASLLTNLRKSGGAEIIVVDGGSEDYTCDIAVTHADKVLVAKRGRGAQMNAGARAATRDILLFLHADSLPPANWLELIRQAVSDGRTVGGAFDLRINSPEPAYQVIGRAASLRSRLLRTPYGDQGIFVKRGVFQVLDGFRELPIMEDVEFVSRLRKQGRLAFIAEPMVTSARKWHQHGILRATACHWLVALGYCLKVPPKDLAALHKAILSKPRL